MLALIHQHPLLIAVGLLLTDLACWRLLPADGKAWRCRVLSATFSPASC